MKGSAISIGSCVTLPAQSIEAYEETAKKITYNRFSYYLGEENLNQLNLALGYSGKFLLKHERYASYSSGKWEGKSAICMKHSATHYIWLI